MFEPFREKRHYYEEHKDEVKQIILSGSEKANQIGDETVRKVEKAMHVLVE